MRPARVYEHPQLELRRRWVEFGSPNDLTEFVLQPGIVGPLDEAEDEIGPGRVRTAGGVDRRRWV